MASYETPRTLAGGTLIGGRLSAFFANIAGSIAAWNDARVTRNALSRLSDHELDDLGLTRADIDNIENLRR